MRRYYLLRWLFFMTGLVLLALGITLTIKGQRLGIGPWDVFHVGLFQKNGLTVGMWSIIIGVLIIGTTVIITKKLPRIGTLLNMLLLGIFIDIFNFFIPEPSTWPGVISIFLLGVVAVGYGTGVYVSANLGAGPRDSIMMLIVEKTGWNICMVRRGIELVVLAIGFSLGGPVGVGTLVTALFVGSIIHVSLPQSKLILQRSMGHNNAQTVSYLESKRF
ncbi:YczE/YyaS/YitT family protein [Jeotgalibacillus marinus]|uniref:YitT family protein n=1 Tax=Jeotgalibacillus marinus TaxID=86667 RepID=A0ABV3PYX7_9BACL